MTLKGRHFFLEESPLLNVAVYTQKKHNNIGVQFLKEMMLHWYTTELYPTEILSFSGNVKVYDRTMVQDLCLSDTFYINKPFNLRKLHLCVNMLKINE